MFGKCFVDVVVLKYENPYRTYNMLINNSDEFVEFTKNLTNFCQKELFQKNK